MLLLKLDLSYYIHSLWYRAVLTCRSVQDLRYTRDKGRTFYLIYPNMYAFIFWVNDETRTHIY